MGAQVGGSPNAADGYCPRLQGAVELIGSRWTGSILVVLLAGARRFSDIRDAVPGLSDRLLCERLRRLEAEGLVTREAEGSAARAVAYAPTSKAEELMPALEALAVWARRWHRGPDGTA